jgi:hypothetical protein
MKRPKFDGCEDRNQARFPEGESCHRGTHRRTLVWLLASALAVLGTTEAMSAARHKSESSDRKNAAEAEHHKPESPDRKKDKKTADAEHHKSESSHQKKDKKAAEAERHKKAAVMENLEVYRVRFGDNTATIEPNLHRAAAAEARARWWP